MLSTLDDSADVVRQLTEVARTVVPRDPVRVRAHRDGPLGFDRALWQRFAELGWLGLLVPEHLDGADGGVPAAAAVARTLGSAGRLEPFVAAGVIVPACLAALPSTTGRAPTAAVRAGRRDRRARVGRRGLGTAGRPSGVGDHRQRPDHLVRHGVLGARRCRRHVPCPGLRRGRAAVGARRRDNTRPAPDPTADDRRHHLDASRVRRWYRLPVQCGAGSGPRGGDRVRRCLWKTWCT